MPASNVPISSLLRLCFGRHLSLRGHETVLLAFCAAELRFAGTHPSLQQRLLVFDSEKRDKIDRASRFRQWQVQVAEMMEKSEISEAEQAYAASVELAKGELLRLVSERLEKIQSKQSSAPSRGMGRTLRSKVKESSAGAETAFTGELPRTQATIAFSQACRFLQLPVLQRGMCICFRDAVHTLMLFVSAIIVSECWVGVAASIFARSAATFVIRLSDGCRSDDVSSQARSRQG